MRSLLAALGVALLVAPACQGNSDAEAPLVDGRYFGYIRSVDDSATPPTIAFDPAEFLTGDEANAAAVEDGVIPKGEAVPNDYYIRNKETAGGEFAVASDVAVTHIQCPDSCTEGLPGDFEAFAASFVPGDASLAAEYRGAQSQYWITVEDGEVVAIDEQYVP